MAFLGISQALDPWLRPSTDYAAHLLPSFMQDTQQKAELAERMRQFNEGAPLRTAQTEHEAAQAQKIKYANDMYAQIMGGQPLPQGLNEFGIEPREIVRNTLGLHGQSLQRVFNPQTWGLASDYGVGTRWLGTPTGGGHAARDLHSRHM